MPHFEIVEGARSPNFPGMMLATVIALKDLGGSGKIDEITEQIIVNEEITEEQQSFPHGDDHRTKLNYYLAWARTYLNHHNAIENSGRGVWALTEIGIQTETLEQTAEYYRAYKAYKAQRDHDQRQRRTARAGGDENPPVADELPDETNNPDNDDWKTTLLEILGSIHPNTFERLSQRLLREAGFIKVKVLGQVADGGIDGTGILRVNLLSFHVYFQCKRWKGGVGSKEIRDFRGALDGRAKQGLFITTSHFTDPATKEATRDGALLIDLIDGNRLCDLLKEYELGVETSPDGQTTINPDYFNSI